MPWSHCQDNCTLLTSYSFATFNATLESMTPASAGCCLSAQSCGFHLCIFCLDEYCATHFHFCLKRSHCHQTAFSRVHAYLSVSSYILLHAHPALPATELAISSVVRYIWFLWEGSSQRTSFSPLAFSFSLTLPELSLQWQLIFSFSCFLSPLHP